MSSWLEHILVMLLVYVLWRVLWQRHQQATKKRKKKGKRRQWQPKSPKDCPVCQEGVKLSLFRVQRSVKPWSQVKSRRGRKKTIPTQGYACPNPACDYAGIVDAEVHALVGNGKGGKEHPIQHFRCQACRCSFSSRRNTPLYYLKTSSDRIEMCLWLLAEGVDISVLVRFTGHVDATVTRWLLRAGQHSENLHNLLFVNLELDYLQVDELKAPIVGDKENWLWVAIEPVTKIVPALHIGKRTTEEAMVFIHLLVLTLAPGCVPAFTSDGIRQYFYAITAHFGHWKYPDKQWKWMVSDLLLYGQLVKRRNKRKHDGQSFTFTRMMWGRYAHLFQRLREVGLSGTIQTAFIERLNLTIRQGIAALSRRTWSKARSNEMLYLHVQWWRSYYHFSREHETLRVRIPGLRRRYRPRSPAMAAGITDRLWSVGDILHLPIIAQGGVC
jgi:IS1 family transposase/transposase-like protein